MSQLHDFSLTPEPARAADSSEPDKRHPLSGVFPYLLGSLTTLLLFGGAQFLLQKPEPQPIAIQAPPTAEPTDTPAPTPLPSPTATPAPIIVFVSGAVVTPGLYQLPAEARVGDAIQRAGGLTADAAMGMVNQAEKLWDGAHLQVPTQSEAAAITAAPTVLSGGQPPAAVAQAPGVVSDGGPIDLNSASLAQLDALPGIGPSKAQAIIDNRPYASVDDLERVPGIGASTLEQLRPLVMVQ
jgi:competence protein ComEA